MSDRYPFRFDHTGAGKSDAILQPAKLGEIVVAQPAPGVYSPEQGSPNVSGFAFVDIVASLSNDEADALVDLHSGPIDPYLPTAEEAARGITRADKKRESDAIDDFFDRSEWPPHKLGIADESLIGDEQVRTTYTEELIAELDALAERPAALKISEVSSLAWAITFLEGRIEQRNSRMVADVSMTSDSARMILKGLKEAAGGDFFFDKAVAANAKLRDTLIEQYKTLDAIARELTGLLSDNEGKAFGYFATCERLEGIRDKAIEALRNA